MSQFATRPRAPLLKYGALCAYWFGTSLHWMLLLTTMIQSDVLNFVGDADKGATAGWLMGGFSLFSLILPPFLGQWSDRIGKRLPFMTYGSAINVLGLGVMALAPNFWGYGFGFFLVHLGNSTASAPYSGLVPDTVPENEKGAVSGVIGLFQLFGQIVGGVSAFALAGNRIGLYAVVALSIALSTWITVRGTKEPAITKNTDSSIPWRDFLQAKYFDFRWVFGTRAMMETGRFSVQPFLQYYLAAVIGTFALGSWKIVDKAGKPDAGLAVTLLIVMLSVTAAVTAIISGPYSDRIGKKPVLYAAGACMAIAALGFALARDYPTAIGLGLIFGLGYGAFVSVDWALATSIMPDATKYARDMGVWHIALVFPQLFTGPLGQILDAGNKASPNGGYPLLFGLAVVFFTLGTVFVSRVRGTR
jgi:MFS family permease